MTYWKLKSSPLAQLVELLPYMQAVVGSIPTGTTKCSHGLVVMSPPFHGGYTGSNPVGSTIDNGFPHSTKVDSSEWNRNSSPCAEDLVKLKMHLRLERDGYSIIINDIECKRYVPQRNDKRNLYPLQSFGFG